MQGDSVVFEAFEASAISERVLASENALQWDFPACTVAMPYSRFNESTFLENLAEFLEQASTESIKSFAAHTNKAGSLAYESRDTVDPSLITTMLMTLLEANGNRTYPPLLRKRVRDDVCWTDGAKNPWRRCSFWLVLRVGVQRHLSTLLGGEAGRAHYKFLICLVLAQIMNESLEYLSPESVAFLKTKLCRRLVKLEVDKDRAPPTVRATYEYLFTALEPLFHKTTQDAIEHTKTAWNKLKMTIRRPVPSLQPNADPQDLVLSLPNSRLFLQQVLTQPLYRPNKPQSSIPYQLSRENDVSATLNKSLGTFAKKYYSLAEFEAESFLAVPASELVCKTRCVELANKIDTYLDTVAGAYDSNSEQNSIMLLTVMELWVSLDECATKIFSLLKDYNPGFPPEILGVLQLPQFRDMCRVQRIQEYLQRRYTLCNHSNMTIFHEPTMGCFSERFFTESPESVKLQDLHQRIETAAEVARKIKEKEWQKMSAEHEDLMKKISRSTCLYTTDELEPFSRIHDDYHCKKCFMERNARRMKIQVHEHPLPSNPIKARAVVFELGCPKPFAAYRDVTWRILGTLAHSKQIGAQEPKMLLRDYSELIPYLTFSTRSLSLASTNKSFLTTHYSAPHFPVPLKDVCLPNGLNFVYFDNSTKMWPARLASKPSFARYCSLEIPSRSPFSSLQPLIASAVDGNGPSSSEIIASQTKCPSGLNVHEFTAFHGLFSGKIRRWPQILRELGESNLNFSTEATALLISQLVMQIGPAHQADPLGVIHRVFRDEHFCKRLVEQLDQRLEGISSNWRETHCMEMLVALILRLFSASSLPMAIIGASNLLEKARAITRKWISLLQIEIYRATDSIVSRRYSDYAFRAALLCRRTFAVYVDDDEQILPPAALCCFIECSIAIQETLFGDPAALPLHLRNAFIRDLKMVYRMRENFRRSLEASPGSMTSAIKTFWPEPEDGPSRSLSGLKFLQHSNEWWTHWTVDATEQNSQQTLHYHLLEGHLLLDGQPLRKLPAEYRKGLERLIPGNQSLLIYPSGLLGMTYMLAIRMYDHQIHVGFRNGKLIIRAYLYGSILEYIPPEAFGDPLNFDLPSSLVKNCFHWLNLKTGVIEIRELSNMWRPSSSNWRLDFNTRFAHRRQVTLVDPQSSLFQRIAHIFEGFEYRHELTVLQPTKGTLSVQLDRLDLSFTVNKNGLLGSLQLRSEVDPNQDAGTWYGLKSKLVLRDIDNPRQRSIIVPMGDISCKRNEFHVTIEVANNGIYGKFSINHVLGRLDCPTEPLLLYLKARYHSYTSFIIPDSLTGRTGTEEALHCLSSGLCSPWTSLNLDPHRILLDIASLTPRREFYPKNLKTMQQVFWNDNLTTTIQHDGFKPIVETIRRKSEQLAVFAVQKVAVPLLKPHGDIHLLRRSYVRRYLYQRQDLDQDGEQASPDLSYGPWDRFRSGKRKMNVFETVSIIYNWPSKMLTTTDLAGILQGWPTIGGCDRSFDKTLLSDRLTVDLALEWGPLINLCRISGLKDRHKLMFLFAVISFRDDINMDAVRTLIAFSTLEGLEALDPPSWPSYSQFRQNQIPHSEYLILLAKPYCISYSGDERSRLQPILSSKQRKEYEAAKRAHVQQRLKDCEAIAKYLIDQWPCPEPTVKGFSKPVLVDLAGALEVIRPEWLRLLQNLELSRYIQAVQLFLNSRQAEEVFGSPETSNAEFEILQTRCRGGEIPTLSRNLVRKTGLILSQEESSILLSRVRQTTDKSCEKAPPFFQTGNLSHSLQTPTQADPTPPSLSPEIQELENIINSITESLSTVRIQYRQDLIQSLKGLKMFKKDSKKENASTNIATLGAEISKAQQEVQNYFNRICEAFKLHDARAKWLEKGDLWPSITPVTVLEQLRSTSASDFGNHLKENLISYAWSVTNWQRLMRIEDAKLKDSVQRLLEEQENTGHENWQPLENPDWLLLEFDISPASGLNSVLQMNMGQGESICF